MAEGAVLTTGTAAEVKANEAVIGPISAPAETFKKSYE
jgi:hypothetical protein